MFRSLTISRKLAALVAVPVCAAVVLVFLGVQTLQQVRIGGETYQRIAERDELLIDSSPPSVYLVEASLSAHRMLAGAQTVTDTEELVALQERMATLEAEYNAQLDYWQQNLVADDAVTQQLFDEVDVSGQDFWIVYANEVLPAVGIVAAEAAKGGGQVSPSRYDEIIRPATEALAQLDQAFDSHREQVDTLVSLAWDDVRAVEADADGLARQRMRVLAFATLLAAIVVAVAGSLMARSIAEPVRTLIANADEVATTTLPKLVEAVKNLPDGAEPPTLDPLPVHGSKEIERLAASFQSMQDTAVRLAAREAQLRRHVSSVFVNLGRRNQSLLNRTLNFITVLEQNERNPETLENLFRLDHLVTRMRRNADSLLVLAGAEPARTWSDPIDLSDIVRGALSEIEAYDRVTMSELKPVQVRGDAAADVAHLLAELLENATTFSPPSALVDVTGRYSHDGYLLTVLDEGIGMSDEELDAANERLASDIDDEVAPRQVLGLYVVSRLARRHGIAVELDRAPSGGVAAVAKLPLAILTGTIGSAHDDPGLAPAHPTPWSEQTSPDTDLPVQLAWPRSPDDSVDGAAWPTPVADPAPVAWPDLPDAADAFGGAALPAPAATDATVPWSLQSATVEPVLDARPDPLAPVEQGRPAGADLIGLPPGGPIDDELTGPVADPVVAAPSPVSPPPPDVLGAFAPPVARNEPAVDSRPAADPGPSGPETTTGGLARRRPGAQMPDTTLEPAAMRRATEPAVERATDPAVDTTVETAVEPVWPGVDVTVDAFPAPPPPPAAGDAADPLGRPRSRTGIPLVGATAEPAVPVDTINAGDTVDTVEAGDTVDTVDTVEAGDTVDAVDPFDPTLRAELADPVPAEAVPALARRVRGAHLFDTGPGLAAPVAAEARSADDVRAALASFQHGRQLAAHEATPQPIERDGER